MNIAFSAIVLALLLLPGGLFRYGYLRGFFRRSPAAVSSLTDDLAWVLLTSSFVHSLAIAILARFGIATDYHVVLPLLVGQFGKDQVLLTEILDRLPQVQGAYAAYFAVTAIGAYILGMGLHWIVRRFGWDRKVAFLRFPNDWHYALDPGANQQFGVTPEVFLSTVVDQKNDAYLYRGVVSDWQLDRTGGLERVELKNAYRRLLKDDRPENQPHQPQADQRYYPIVGERLILRMSEMRTINIQYVFTVPADEYEVEDPSTVVSSNDTRDNR
jgi:hypothetical protein